MENKLTPKELLSQLVKNAISDFVFFQSYRIEDLDKARQRALDAITHYKEIKNILEERQERQTIYSECLTLIEKLD